MIFTNALAIRPALALQWCLAAKHTRAVSSRQAALLSSTQIIFRCADDGPATHYYFHTTTNNNEGMNLLHPRGNSFSRKSNSSYIITTTTREKTNMIPRKAALALTPKARDIFKKMIAATGSEGIILKYEISSQHALRMAFKFDLIKDAKKELTAQDEGVSLEVLEDGVTPKPPSESWEDNLPKLYVHHAAFMKVLGGTLDVEINPETGDMTPKLYDREGHEMDPNA